jgi:nitrite reductase/ring-hydroxylating ferredoxin subunit
MLNRLTSKRNKEDSVASSPVPIDLDAIPDEAFEVVAKANELSPGGMMYVEAGKNEDPIVLINFEGEFYALSDICTHEEASLSDGEISGDEIECPLHGGAFEIRTGLPAGFPVVVPAKMYPVRVRGEEVQIAAAFAQ